MSARFSQRSWVVAAAGGIGAGREREMGGARWDDRETAGCRDSWRAWQS
jgi:hypothetical protein